MTRRVKKGGRGEGWVPRVVVTGGDVECLNLKREKRSRCPKRKLTPSSKKFVPAKFVGFLRTGALRGMDDVRLFTFFLHIRKQSQAVIPVSEYFCFAPLLPTPNRQSSLSSPNKQTPLLSHTKEREKGQPNATSVSPASRYSLRPVPNFPWPTVYTPTQPPPPSQPKQRVE